MAKCKHDLICLSQGFTVATKSQARGYSPTFKCKKCLNYFGLDLNKAYGQFEKIRFKEE